ncbi:N-acetylmuramoyl-L-alanine amidase [Portibacter marinus]|uniref:N-acetylmuramoyl-L-alanine amidase n=1 Tax=Portibacter marinus TaxID=2898660 RepID=UPI001F3B0E4F|nr:N-acetylmuramoyl-L-alanine amidase [Portibacter marinus]
MKKLKWSLLLVWFFIQVIDAQTSVIEFQPNFYMQGTHFISDPQVLSVEKTSLDFIRLSCYHSENKEANITYRIKREHKWSSWQVMEEQREFVASDRRAYSTNVFRTNFQAIQFRTDRKLGSALTFRLFIASPSKPRFVNQAFSRTSSCELPLTCLRDCWCPTCPIDPTPQFTEPTHLIVHHSAGVNESNNFELIVESIWDLHVNTNGWDDIGYNWLIDPNGVLYEGRPDDYQGAHFSCLNENTVGICVLGTYTDVPPSEEALTTLTNLLAYEAVTHGIDVEETAYHEKGDYFLQTIAGHRDSQGSDKACSSTICPGDQFYPLLEPIRQIIAELPCYGEITSTEEQLSNFEVEIYPNPTRDIMFVKTKMLGDTELQIIDNNGKMLEMIRANVQVHLSHLSAGMYYLESGGKVVGKFVKY